ncbi:MAG: hypothetical protein AAFP03_17260 [Cyanobacteria bacterium J06598_3]
MLLKSSGGRLSYRPVGEALPKEDRSHLFGTLSRMRETLAWSDWSWSNRRTFVVTCWQVLQQMRAWLKTLKRQDLETLLQAES